MRGAVRLSAIVVIALLAFPATLIPAEQAEGPQRSGALGPQTLAPWVSVFDNQQVMGIVGKEVRSSTDEAMGRIVDVLVDRNGQARGAVIDFGGFLGVGSRRIVVDWATLHFPTDGKSDRLTVDLTRDQVKSAPEYKDGKPVVVLGALPPIGPAAPEM